MNKIMMAFRVGGQQKDNWKQAAKAKGLSLSQWMRTVLDRVSKKQNKGNKNV